VHLSRDRVPVVIHDESVDRTTDGKGAVADLTLRQLRRLDAGSWFSTSFAEERLPTLEDVLQWAGERLRLNLEIKSADAAQAVLDLLGGYPRSRVLLSSFDHRLLTSLHQRAPHLQLAFLCDSLFWRRILKKAVHSKAAAFHPSARLVSRPLVFAARRAGIAVHPWTVDDPALARKLLRVGCSGIFTNDPASLTR
jgi:glycerophosphoryl diester phosphodiesterase